MLPVEEPLPQRVKTRPIVYLAAGLGLLAPLRAEALSIDGAVAVAAAVQESGSAQSPERGRDLRDLFARGYMLQDRNLDDVVDFVSVRIVVPSSPTGAEAAAAANVASRLGFETSALNLDLWGTDAERVASYDVPVVVVGSRNGLASRIQGGGLALSTGEGSISLIRPDAFFRAGGVLIEGGDATGLAAAAAYLAGRYPNVWGLRGSTYSDAAERIERFLRGRQVALSGVTIERIVIDADRRGVGRLLASVDVADTISLDRAVRALRDTSRADSTAIGAAAGRGGGRGGAPRDSAGEAARLSDVQIEDVQRLDITIRAVGRTEVVRLLPPRPWPTRSGSEFTARDAPDFTLSDLYSIRGLFRDTNQDLVPDRTDAYVSLGGGLPAGSAIELAARVGLETAGMRLPFVREAGLDDHPERRGLAILLGSRHDRVDRLRGDGRLHGGGEVPGEGSIEVVRGGLDGRTGVVVSGGDEAGVAAITNYVAGRMPYLWDYGKGNYRLSNVEDEVRRFFQARSTGGQAGLAGHKLRTWLARLDGRDIDSIAVEVATNERLNGLDRWAGNLLKQHFPAAKASVSTWATGFGQGKTIFTQDVEIPWEVDDFRASFTSKVLPAVRNGSHGRIEVRVSESPQIRDRLRQEIEAALRSKGADPAAFDIRVLSAYKQGYSWLHDAIMPRLRGRPVGSIAISYHTLKDSREVKWQTVESDTRWLQEIYPIDAILAHELGVPDSIVSFTPTQQRVPIYSVVVKDPAGRELVREDFDPAYVVRPYFDLFPEYERIRVTTGWVTAEVDGAKLLDERIVTDPERFWDILQKDTYARIIDYVMDVQDGRPSPGNAPFYDEFRVELSLSEPNYRIGVDEEVISSLEALHEDIYFETLTLFDLIGNRWGVGNLNYAGRVLPYITSGRDGRPGHAKITFTGKDRGVPELVLTYRERGREPVRDRYPLSPLPVDSPKLRAIAAHAGDQGLARLLFEVTTVDSVERYDENRLKAAESAIDRALHSAELLAGMVDVVAQLQRDGVAEDVLSFDRVAALAFRFVLHDSTRSFSQMATLPRSRHPASTRNPVLAAPGFRYTGQRLVQWRTPIPPVESDSILARLGTFPGVIPYYVTRSFLGQNIFAADFLPPQDAHYVSQAKLNAFKPTLFLSGRQHANKVSSTSHILRLGELLVTDSSYRELLKKVNVVLHPITNADGARLAWEMQRDNPDFMLHAGYLGALGVDATAGAGTSDPIYPESKARPELQEAWLPDISMNMHGYPSHEWVQLFAGYSAWVRGRTGTQRSWWLPRGWFVPGFNWTDDPRYPDYRTAQFAILDSMGAAITGAPAVESMNRRLYARYAKYGRQDVENFRENFRNGILVYEALRGRPLGNASGASSTRVNYFSLTTEAPDETARGEWLELVASAGLAHSSALLRYLAEGQNRIERETAEFEEFVTRNVFRKKPVLPVRPSPGDAPR